MVSWEQSDHPVAVWKLNFGGTGVDGVDILSMNPAFVAQYLNDNLRHILRGHGMEFDRDWTKLTNEHAIDLLCHAMGRSRDARPRLQSGYVITVDNLLKMLSIALRMRCGLPVDCDGRNWMRQEFTDARHINYPWFQASHSQHSRWSGGRRHH